MTSGRRRGGMVAKEGFGRLRGDAELNARGATTAGAESPRSPRHTLPAALLGSFAFDQLSIKRPHMPG